MALSGSRVKMLAIGLLNNETDRDRQRKVGASQISNPCTRCLASDLSGVKQGPSKYWLGGKIGTAVHKAIEEEIPNSEQPELKDVRIEEKIILGQLEGYGTISSRPDLTLAGYGHLIDWKTTTRAKSKKIQKWIDGVSQDAATTYTMQKYIGQSQLYAWGSNQAGTFVDGISLVFINRDGTNEIDVLEYTYEYDEAMALALWNRLVALWDELREGSHPENYPSHSECYTCSINGLL